MPTITIKALLEAGVHFGHQTFRWNPKMVKYIFGERNNIHIIDLQKTVQELKKSYKFVRDMSAEGKTMLFVGTKRQAQEIICEEAVRSGSYYVNKRWLGGTLTNFETIKNSIERLKKLEKMKEEGVFNLMTKKEAKRYEKELSRLENLLVGIKNMDNLPDMMFVIDPLREEIAVKEARKMKIPIIACCDTDCDPEMVDFPIPANDDAVRSIRIFTSLIAEAVIEGKKIYEEKMKAAAEENTESGTTEQVTA